MDKIHTYAVQYQNYPQKLLWPISVIKALGQSNRYIVIYIFI